jgi:hypothetical protein
VPDATPPLCVSRGRAAHPPPPGYELTRFDVDLVELSSRYRGTEIRVAEFFTRQRAERRRVTLLRYSVRADRYVVYSPKL